MLLFQSLVNQEVNKRNFCHMINKYSIVLICFSFGGNKKHCEVFDGSSSTSTTESNHGHSWGNLGLYKNQPTTVGSSFSTDTRKVETLTNNGWSVIGDPPIR